MFLCKILLAVFLLPIAIPACSEETSAHGDATICDGGPDNIPALFPAVTASCEAFPLEALRALRHKKDLSEFLHRQQIDLWDTGIPKRLFIYKLRLQNDSSHVMSVAPADPAMIRSAYVTGNGGFTYRVPACSTLVASFLSPWAPKNIAEVSMAVGGPIATIVDGPNRKPRKEWLVYVHNILVPLPYWYQYFALPSVTRAIPKDAATSKACK